VVHQEFEGKIQALLAEKVPANSKIASTTHAGTTPVQVAQTN
jgi:hypothetical protein